MSAKSVDVVVSFDTTGSMYPCLTQVRRRVTDMVSRLFRTIPGLRVGIIAHGDYCDVGNPYVTRRLDLTSDQAAINRFVNNVPATNGGDSPECYELVLHEARDFSWGSGVKTLVLIGDDVPHPATDRQNTKRLDWRTEIDLLVKMGVNVYGVQALNRAHATSFYREIAQRTGGLHLTLNQFSTVVDLVIGICLRQYDPAQVPQWEEEVTRQGRMDRGLDEAFSILTGRSRPSDRFARSLDLEAVAPGRFQVLSVDESTDIKGFVQANGLIFKKGRGFYEYTKTETIQDYKEIVLRHNGTGDLFTGERARELMGLPRVGSVRGRFSVPAGYTAFVQSTSVNRKLIGGTQFLYEVDLSR